MTRYLLAFAISAGVVSPALAADYYIVRGPDKHCKVVETKPTEKTTVIVGNKAYTTKSEAETQLKAVCK